MTTHKGGGPNTAWWMMDPDNEGRGPGYYRVRRHPRQGYDKIEDYEPPRPRIPDGLAGQRQGTLMDFGGR